MFYTLTLLSVARAISGMFLILPRTCENWFALCVARHCVNRCSLKSDNECFSDPKCIWDPSSNDGSFLDGARSGLADEICARFATATKTAYEENNVEEVFTSEAICAPFCEELVTTNCTDYMFESMLGEVVSEIDNSEVLRKLQEVFDSGVTPLWVCQG